MNIREAILKAADSVENGGMYDFDNPHVEHSFGTPMCMIGWLGYHLGGFAGQNIEDVCEACGFEEDELYRHRSGDFSGFTSDPRRAAALMRSFADERFPAAKTNS